MLLQILRIKHRKIGFTLIELLIVIAIILILISIALPNFIEARLRAQVTKARGEINSMRTAFEMYMNDFKIYPRGCITGFDSGRDRCYDNWGFVAESLTTPIKYMKQKYDDIFSIGYSVLGSYSDSPNNAAGGNFVKYRTTKRRPYWEGFPKEIPKLIPSQLRADNPTWTFYERTNPSVYKSKQYLISSLGPDHDEDVLPYYTMTTGKYKPGDEFYSPTNGTVSGGDLIFVGP